MPDDFLDAVRKEFIKTKDSSKNPLTEAVRTTNSRTGRCFSVEDVRKATLDRTILRVKNMSVDDLESKKPTNEHIAWIALLMAASEMLDSGKTKEEWLHLCEYAWKFEEDCRNYEERDSEIG